MTDAQARALKPGDRVLTAVGAERVLAEVVVCHPSFLSGRPMIRLRRPGRLPGGRRRPSFQRLPGEVERAPPSDPGTANVYADWLEEHGESRAAAKLRAAFPLS